MAKEIKFPNSNLYLAGSGYDVNGNKIVKLQFANQRGFSIQTGGSLKLTGSILRGLKTLNDMQTVSKSDLLIIEKEVCNYIKNFGSEKQKSSLRIYK